MGEHIPLYPNALFCESPRKTEAIEELFGLAWRKEKKNGESGF